MSESPKSFLLFSAMTTLGACLGRRVWMDQDIHQVRPILNLLLIGPSGIGKSSAVKVAKKLLPYVPINHQPQFIEGGTTKEKLHQDLVDQPKAILFAPELAAFFSKEKYKENLIPYVTNLLDYEDSIELRTRKDDIVRVINPSVSIIGASTLPWLQEQLPDSAVSGGFLARFLILNENAKGQRVANPQRLLSARAKLALELKREKVFQEFSDLFLVHEGNMDFEDYDAAESYSRWYNAYQPETGYLEPFSARAGEFVLRLSVLLAISSRRTSISQADIVSAIKLYTYMASKLGTIVVPTNQQGKLSELVRTTIGDEGLTPGAIVALLRAQAPYAEIEKHLEGLIYSGVLVVDGSKVRRPE